MKKSPGITLLALFVAGCGGSGSGSTAPSNVSPAAPTPPPVPVIRDGSNEQAVAAEVTPPSPPLGATIVVRAPRYLVREQKFDGSPIFLWPAVDEAYVHDLSYNWEFRDGTRKIVRWDQGFVVTLDGDLGDDPEIVEKATEVLTEIARRTGLPVTLGPGGACLVTIDPSVAEDDAVAEANLTFRGPTVTGAKVRFLNRGEISGGARSDYRNTLLHEMGHVIGLGHSPNDRDVMTAGAGPGTKWTEFQDDEALCVRMMYAHRQAGNIFPDRDVALGAASTETVTVTIIN
jgi:hypothetical protein